MNLMELMITIGVDDQASSKIDGLSTSVIAKGTAIGQAMFSVMSSVASTVGSAVEAVVGGAYEQYSAYEQNVGGIQKLFGNMGKTLEEYADAQGSTTEAVSSEWQALENAQNTVLYNASEAYKTAGMSANQYMEQVTGFSAALINSLDGDTQAAAAQADVAMRAISDNVNTFGSNVEDVQNAYQGFAKQNYTMLDNLKLGYGGTKEEMERLIDDANEYASSIGEATDLSIDSFSDVVTAIELIQEKQNIAGTTKREALTTLEGSLNSLKAAWSNWLTELGKNDADMGKLTEQLVESLSAAASNAIPRMATIIGTLVTEVPGLVAQYAPAAAESINGIITDALSSLSGATGIDFSRMWDGLTEGASRIAEAFEPVASSLGGLWDELVSEVPEVAEAFEPVASALEGVAEAAAPVVASFIDGIGRGAEETLVPALENAAPVLETLFDNVSSLLETCEPFAELLGSTLVTAITLVVDAFTSVGIIVSNIIAFFALLFDTLGQAPGLISSFVTQVGEWFGQLPGLIGGFIESVISTIVSWVSTMVANAASAGSGFVNSVTSFLSELPGTVSGFLSSVIGTVAGWVGEFISNAASAASGFASNLISGLSGIPGQVCSIGSNIIKGIADGITGAASTVVSAITGAVGDAISAAKSLLGIASPSKLFKKFGRYTMEGFAIGIDQNAGMPVSSMEAVVGSIKSAAQASASLSTSRKTSAAELTSETNSLLRQLLAKDNGLYIDGKAVAKAIAKPMNRQLGTLAARGF